MGAWGALIMAFFGSVFASLTLYWQFHQSAVLLYLPAIVFVVIAIFAASVIRAPGTGIEPSVKGGKAIMLSSMGEGVGLFLVSNIVINLGRPDLLLPAMAFVVGAHFVPIAFFNGFRPFYLLAIALLVAAGFGFVAPSPMGGAVSGFVAAGTLWVAAALAVRRDGLAKRYHATATI